MEQARKDRISELTRLSRERELTPEETKERELLRAEYLAEWRLGAQQALDNTYIQRPDGTKQKLKRKK
jgi:uncharacterized protein YnzC (UPF0291/DUF896 family)